MRIISLLLLLLRAVKSLSIQEQFYWRRAAMPLAEAAGLENHELATASSILHSVLASDPESLESSLRALSRSAHESLRILEALIPADECASLCKLCDENVFSQLAQDNVDRLPDFQVNVDTLTNLPVSEETRSLLADLPRSLFDCQSSPSRIGIFIRRYCSETRPYFPWHIDGNAFTANVALSSPNDYSGGHLRVLVEDSIRTLKRNQGDVTVHTNAVCHAVSPVDFGVRHTMLLFYHM
uniref:Prolyl 4-hydroxylase alpha subunit Fe(2+) 2OG dioxygenase domain-containing protein n=1 Tax=Aureoumbra lagunensis TaxID=44058 RepID=A0A7S3NQV5_9STRA|mmetsp:Transcript_12919/g.19356  ORF Transcript_12919/g.19356 Transcript_12919/m.19356 type:complete len:239 (+) Transcript_12919:27-743(+)